MEITMQKKIRKDALEAAISASVARASASREMFGCERGAARLGSGGYILPARLGSGGYISPIRLGSGGYILPLRPSDGAFHPLLQR
jgi:hypothetical protein